MPVIVGGRYGLSSKDFDPAMAKTVFDELKKPAPKRGFTVGINDDVSHTSLSVDASFDIEPPDVVRALFYGLGADGTVGANKNSTIILAADPNRHAQGYFVYDSKKSGSYTISHLRFGPRPIRAPYLLKSANFVGIHKFDFLYKLDTLGAAAPGATVLINSPYGAGRGVGRATARGAAADHRQEAQAPRHRRVEGGVGAGARVARQHDPADLLLRAVGRHAAEKAIEAIKTATETHVCQEGQGDRPEELRRRSTAPWRTCTRSACRRRRPASASG